MVKIDKETIDVANERRLERAVNAGVASAHLFRAREAKQVKVLEDDYSKIIVALFMGGSFMMEMSHGRMMRRRQQAIWVWDGYGVIRTEPINNYRVHTFFDEEELAQKIFDGFKTPSDVWQHMQKFSMALPKNLKI